MSKPTKRELATAAIERKNPDYTPSLMVLLPLGFQHVTIMLVGNIAIAFIISGALGLGAAERILLIQAALLFAGVATLFQTMGLGPVIGARLPVVQGTSFAFIVPMIAIGKLFGMAGIFGAAILNGVFQIVLAFFIAPLRKHITPLVSGLVVFTIGVSLLAMAVKYAGGHPDPKVLGAEFASWRYIGLAGFVVVIALVLRVFSSGVWGAGGVLIAIVAGYGIGYWLGMVDFAQTQEAAWVSLPNFFHFGVKFSVAMIWVMILMAFITTIETIGNISAITMGGAERMPTLRELKGGILANGLGSLVAALGNGLPMTSYSQNAGLIAYSGYMSRHVVSLAGIILILAGMVPKFAAVIIAMPNAVLGGAGLVMFGMVMATGLKLIAQEPFTQRNMLIIAVSLSAGLGIYAVPEFTRNMDQNLAMLLATPIIPVAIIAFVLNLVLPVREE